MWLSFACLAYGAEIVAWKTPLARYSWRHSGPEKQTRLTNPPEASLFFRSGDELWDLGKFPKDERIETDPPLEWAVWNATTSTLVTKSDWNGIWQLHQKLRVSSLPKLCRVTMEIFDAPEDGTPLSDKSAPLSKLSWTSRFQTKTEVKEETDERSIQAMTEASIGEDRFDLIDLLLEATIQAPSQPKLNFKASLALRNGQPMWIARDFDGKQGLDLRITARVETNDATPFQDAMRLQVGNESQSLVPSIIEPARHRVADNRWLSVASLSPDQLMEYDPSHKPGSQVDPFADPPESPTEVRFNYQEVEVAEALRPWIGGRAFDLSQTIRNSGINMGSGDSAGFDPIRGIVFLDSGSETELDKFEALFSGGCWLPAKNIRLSTEGSGHALLTTRSGTTASLTRTDSANKTTKTVKIEPLVGENGDLIDLRIHSETRANTESGTLFNASNTLCVGQYQDLLTGSDGKPLLRAKAEIVRP